MFAAFRERLILKLGALMLATVAAGFLASGVYATRRQAQLMQSAHTDAASLFARGLAAGVRSSMLTGDPLATREMLASVKQGLAFTEVRVFGPAGDEVFAPRPPPPDPRTLPPALREVMQTLEHRQTPQGTDLFPIEHEDRCTRCHQPPGNLRGVLEISLAGAARAVTDDRAARVIVAESVRVGFIQIMTARRADTTPDEFADQIGDNMDHYFDEVKQRAPAVTDVAVFNARGYPSPMGDESVSDRFPTLTREVIAAAVESNSVGSLTYPDATVQITPLANEERCHACHRPTDRMRGAIVVVTRPQPIPLLQTLADITELSVRHIMLSGLGRLTTGYLDALAATGVVGTLRLYDPLGRLYHDALSHDPPPALVAEALRRPNALRAETTSSPGHESFMFVQSMANSAECQRCHGTDRDVRGAIQVVLDTSAAARERAQMSRQAATFGLATMFAVMLALYLALTFFVLHPVRRLGAVAEHVGSGNLDVEAPVGSGDEVGRLGVRLNEMVAGLRQKIQLSKFVSQGAVQAVASSGRDSIVLGGIRRHVVVLFSDVRGFTSFSEAREPEEVVAMLNAYLNAQTEVVVRHGGDIDKFVGDELMALFYQDDGEQRAVRCAVEMVEAVAKLNVASKDASISIGVGINAGPAVVGAMGAANRMDYTAIGDTVNLGARLCSNAASGQVLFTEAVRAKVADLTDLRIEPLEPIRVKGKAQPIPIFSAHRAEAGPVG